MGVGERLEAKSIRVCSCGSLKDGLKGRVLLNPHRALGKRKLLISHIYLQLIEELCDYSHMKSSEDYVSTLAIALNDT